jgi:hypothetical protein
MSLEIVRAILKQMPSESNSMASPSASNNPAKVHPHTKAKAIEEYANAPNMKKSFQSPPP